MQSDMCDLAWCRRGEMGGSGCVRWFVRAKAVSSGSPRSQSAQERGHSLGLAAGTERCSLEGKGVQAMPCSETLPLIEAGRLEKGELAYLENKNSRIERL